MMKKNAFDMDQEKDQANLKKGKTRKNDKWSKDEKRLFEEAFEKFGKDYDKIT